MILLLVSFCANAQFEGFKQWYPIGEEADIQAKSSYIKSETILFEANPIVRYSFYNDMLAKIGESTAGKGQAAYVVFKPQIRMYTDNSLPVKTPGYKIELGYQRLFRLKATHAKTDFLSFGLETGHYSNGQSGSAFSELYEDGSPQGDSMYSLITDETNLSEMLNRKSGNFSTDLTEITLNYRSHRFSDPLSHLAKSIHNISLGVTIYHDNFLWVFPFGGYSDEDIRIYGKYRYQFQYEYTRIFKNNKEGKNREYPRLSLSERIELIQGAHPWVNPFRSETRASYAPGGKTTLGFAVFLGVIYGHDNYNYRFVDSGWQVCGGLSWTPSPPPYIGRVKDVEIDAVEIE